MHSKIDISSEDQIEDFNRRLAAQAHQHQHELTLLLAKQLMPDGAVRTRRPISFLQRFRQWIERPAMRRIYSPAGLQHWATPLSAHRPPAEEDILIVEADYQIVEAKILPAQADPTEKEVLP